MSSQRYLKAYKWGISQLKISKTPSLDLKFDSNSLYLGVYLPRKDLITLYIWDEHQGEAAVETLFHELVHVKQLELGLISYKKGKTYYKGKLVKHSVGSKDYENMPIELQADRIGELMRKKYIKIYENNI